MIEVEKKPPSEDLDCADVVRCLLRTQANNAAAQHRAPGRATHTKGTCVRATFEVLNIPDKVFDRAIAARLAMGLFAHAGVYPAVVRFANAAGTILSDRKPDVRALSFSVDLSSALSGAVMRQDFSLQSADTFPINDVHDFAILMRVLSAGKGAGAIRALAALSTPDLLRFARTALLGAMQQHGKTGAYQENRYWSTVPFRLGPDEAVKFVLNPSPFNPVQPLRDEPDSLQDELKRHVNEDDHMSSWEFGIQFLDPARMTRWGLHRKASYWVENASVAWKESQAPFYPVARLTLLPKSVLTPEECRAQHIDVNINCLPEHQPIGGINRGRHAAEQASRQVRQGLATPESILDTLPFAPPKRRSRLRLVAQAAAFAVIAAFVLYYGADLLYGWRTSRNLPPAQSVDQVRYLSQGWGEGAGTADRDTYYYTPQGTSMHGIRYSWFVHLERPFHQTRLADPDHMRRLNFIVDSMPSAANPDQLPLGFARRWDDRLHDNVVDVTCAACHSGQLKVQRRDGRYTAIRIDGGEAMTAFTDTTMGSFQSDLGFSLLETLVNPMKFRRFAAGVLGNNDTWGTRVALWNNLASVTKEVLGLVGKSSAHRLYPTQEGYGRTDALARISNVVFGDHISPLNYHVGNGPVSYPYLWNIWKFDWEQYGSSVSQPMARNVGEALGVGAEFKMTDDYGNPIPETDRYQTSVSFENLYRIESSLQRLTPPQWPADLLGGVDEAKAKRGEELFEQHCVRCHGPHLASDAARKITSPGRKLDDPMWHIAPIDVDFLGTDRMAADNFVRNTVDLTPAGISASEIEPLLRGQLEQMKSRQDAELADLGQQLQARKNAPEGDAEKAKLQNEIAEISKDRVTDASIAAELQTVDPRKVNVGTALNVLGLIIRQKYYKEHHVSPEAQACFAGFDTLDTPLVADGYKPRPLEGVWATPPFLHNGSVPTLYQLLSPVSERSKGFYVGTQDFDPKNVGLVVNDRKGSSTGFWFDTSLPGNHNTGHEFGDGYTKGTPGFVGPALTPQQRMDIIEYLKVRKDDPNQNPDRTPADCIKLLEPSGPPPGSQPGAPSSLPTVARQEFTPAGAW